MESSEYITHKGIDLLTQSYKLTNDTAITKNFWYSNNLKKLKRKTEIIHHINAQNSISYTQIKINQNGSKKINYHHVYYQYYANGLLKLSTDELINHKGKLTMNAKKSYYYLYFNDL